MRRLRAGVRLLLERACFGDPGEMMRGLRHPCEAAFNPDWAGLAAVFMPLADLVGMRRLRAGVRLLLERACFGDPGEMMRGLRHPCEAAFNPDWAGLAAVCMPLATSARPGTRLWAIDQLTILEDLSAGAVFQRALSDELPDV